MPVRFGYNLLMIAFISLLSWIVNYFRNEQESEKRKTDTEQLAREAELIGLHQQMQPHFLFNSLNSISALAGSKPAEARKMIQQLSDFLRGTLKKDDKQWISFEEELNHLQLYLEIEKVRFGHRLKTKMDCEENCLTLKIPYLLLQPVVENAIKFGLYDTTEEIEICISAKTDSHFLIISVSNPFDAELSQPQRGTGFGLSSVQRRLQLLYMRNDLLETSTNENIFVTTIKIPQPL
ncbi:MAG: sensor histidine kinase [Bacteroidia bacterium]